MSRPFRYTFILTLVTVLTGLAAVGGWRYARASSPVNGPIVLISVDSLRADRLPAYGYTQGHTPAIDALARDGVVFERAFSHSPQTLPAHASLLSGRLPYDTGVRDEVGFTVSDEERLLPEMLRDRGFSTAAVVSTFALRKATGIGQGFKFFDAEMAAASPEQSVGEFERSGEASEQVAERWLDRAGTARLFLFLQIDEPTAPYAPPERFANYAPYDGDVAHADEIVGKLIRYLKDHRLYDSSTIILVAGHGEGLGDHGEQEHALFLYNEAIRVPLIIKQADGESAGRRVSDVVQHVDLVPTILDLAKAPIPGNLAGRSLKGLLNGTGRLNRRNVYAESLYGYYHFGWAPVTSITDGRYHYIRAPREELYDLDADPAERTNLLAEPNASIARIIDPLRHDLKRMGVGVAIAAPATASESDQQRLAALGSVGRTSFSTTAAGLDTPGDPDNLIDPKDKVAVLETYRAAVRLGVERRWTEASNLVRGALKTEPTSADLWFTLATFSERAGNDTQAAAAYKHVVSLDPSNDVARLNAARLLLRLQRLAEARQEAAHVVDRIAGFVGPRLQATPNSSRPDTTLAHAHALLAEIALASRNTEAARGEADLAFAADPTMPWPTLIEARLLYQQGRLTDALPAFEKTVAELERLKGEPLADLHFYLGDTLNRLKRPDEAQREFVKELKNFPENARARLALATLSRKAGKVDKAN